MAQMIRDNKPAKVRCAACQKKVKRIGLADHMRDVHGVKPVPKKVDDDSWFCKACQAKYDAARYNLPHRKERYRVYAKTDAGKASKRASQRRWRAKVRAQKEVRA